VPETQGLEMPSTHQHPSVFASALAWLRNWVGAPARPGAPRGIGASPAVREMPTPAYNIINGGLLFRSMDMLAIDRSELAQDDPLLFRELQGRCAACRSRAICAREQALGLDDAGWDAWRGYCPNSSTLLAIGAVQNCARAAQQIRMPRASAKQDRT
jgi:hypothetical protein